MGPTFHRASERAKAPREVALVTAVSCSMGHTHTHTHTRKSPQVEIFTAIGEKSLDVAKAYNNMATVEEERGNDLAALALHKKALEIKCV